MSQRYDLGHPGRNILPQSTNLLLVQIGVAESRTWKQLVQQGEQAEEIITRVRAVENKPRTEKSTRRALEISFQSKRKDTLATETKSPVKSQPARGGGSSSQPRANKQYAFKDEHVDSLFKLLNKSNRLKALKLDVLRKSASPTILTTACIMGC